MVLRKSSLAVAISMVIFPGMMISTGAEAEQRTLSDHASNMMEESSVDLTLRNYYHYNDYRAKQGTPTLQTPDIEEAWAQGAMLDLESGYFMDMVGIDASWYGSFKLHGDHDEWGSKILHHGGPQKQAGFDKRHQKSYDKLGQIFLKTYFGDDSLNAQINAGRMFMSTALLNDSKSYMTPSTTQAVTAHVHWADFSFYGFTSDKASKQTQTGFHKYEGESYTYTGTTPISGKKGDWRINSLGASYDVDEGYGANLQLAQANDYKQMKYLNAYYTVDIDENTSLFFDGHYHKGKGDGKYLQKIDHNAGTTVKTWNSNIWNLVAQLRFNDLKFALSFQKVDGDAYQDSWGESDDNGVMTWNSVLHSDFYRRNEKSLMAKAEYDFGTLGVPGLSLMTLYVKGKYDADSSTTPPNHGTYHEWERDTDIRYSFQENSALKGLSITFRNATFRTYETDNMNENRLIVDYTIALL